MIVSPGYNYLKYQDIVSEPEGARLWNDIESQVSKIALECPDHFFSWVAKEVIPKDARRHNLYCYLDGNYKVMSFAVVAIVGTTAEIIWLACGSNYRRQGIAGTLLTNIEDHLFEVLSVDAIQVLCCSEDTYFAVRGELIDGNKWHGTYAFYKSRGYGLHYRLDHYWAEGSHAYVYIKRKDLPKYRFLQTKTETVDLRPLNVLPDKNTAINKLLYQHIWNCLDAFDEGFVDGIGVTAGKSKKNTLGITGIILGSSESDYCTIFAQRSVDPIPYNSSMRFEYDLRASMLTAMLKDTNESQGVLRYLNEFDEASDIKVAGYFIDYVNGNGSNLDCHIFFKRHQGEDGGYAILYFITPSLDEVDIVWCLNQWSSLAYYSFSLVLELFSFLLAVGVTNKEAHGHAYLMNLVKSVTPVESSKPLEKKIALIKEAIQEHMRNHYRAIVHSKESAIAHYGHTLGHRLSPIQAYFEGNEDSRKRAAANAKFLGDLSVVLQAINLSSTNELYSHPKKSRFLEYEQEDGPLNIVGKLRNEWPMLAESFQPVRVGERDVSQMRVMTLIEFTGNLKDVYLDFMLVDSENGAACRPRDAFYSQLFSELLLNVVRYGGIPKNKVDLDAKQASVRVALTVQSLEHQSEKAPHHCPVLILSNKIGDKVPPSWLSETHWTPWPADRENDGPGMAIAILRRLGLGELWYRYNPSKRVFRVAVWLKGLRIEEAIEA
ncbi:MAG: GNAT family N-acetyltransferase [Candidatus Thiodiazotropha sp.]